MLKFRSDAVNIKVWRGSCDISNRAKDTSNLYKNWFALQHRTWKEPWRTCFLIRKLQDQYVPLKYGVILHQRLHSPEARWRECDDMSANVHDCYNWFIHKHSWHWLTRRLPVCRGEMLWRDNDPEHTAKITPGFLNYNLAKCVAPTKHLGLFLKIKVEQHDPSRKGTSGKKGKKKTSTQRRNKNVIRISEKREDSHIRANATVQLK